MESSPSRREVLAGAAAVAASVALPLPHIEESALD
jgi:hypothetical protein